MVWNNRAFRAIVDSHKNLENLPIICCSKTTEHSPHEWVHYDLDRDVDERVWCTGDFMTSRNSRKLRGS